MLLFALFIRSLRATRSVFSVVICSILCFVSTFLLINFLLKMSLAQIYDRERKREHLPVFSKINHSKTCQSKNLYLNYANASDINMMKNDARKPNNFDYYLD